VNRSPGAGEQTRGLAPEAGRWRNRVLGNRKVERVDPGATGLRGHFGARRVMAHPCTFDIAFTRRRAHGRSPDAGLVR
jgi:hypothetical protein